MGRLLVALVFVASTGSRRAEACHEPFLGPLFAIGATMVETPLIIHDVVVDRSSRAYAIAEITLASIVGLGAISLLRRDGCTEGGSSVYRDSNPRTDGAILGVSIALVAHGIFVLARGKHAGPPWRSSRRIAPTGGVDATHKVVGLGLVGSF
jgi:hypothetical protein